MFTIAHITHEAVEKYGGIGTVLEGLITSPVYRKHVGRTLVIGPTAPHMQTDPALRLGPGGKVLYCRADGIDKLHLGPKLRPIEWAFNTPILYGTRKLHTTDRRSVEEEVLLIDVFNIIRDRLGVFKHRLSDVFGIDSTKHEQDWGYEEYVRLAEPAFYALSALLKHDELPCVLLAHEYMGVPAALKAILDGGEKFRTVFYAHECSTARRIVESHPGHDTMFYNLLPLARKQKRYAEELFKPMCDGGRHALVSRTHLCDAVFAVGPQTADEMRFLGPHFEAHPIGVVYNGVPSMKVSAATKQKNRRMLTDYAQRLLGHRPDVLLTHVMRPVVSKGIWRDFRVCHELDARLAKTGQTAVLFVLTTAGGTRRPQDIRHMEQQYGWPRDHREGYPDLVGPEVEYHRMIEAFNAGHSRVRAILVNQFGWSRETLGDRLPEGMDFTALRCGTDVEFGMATYEPFGISPFEPLCAGAICVVSAACGCAELVREITGGQAVDNIIVADFAMPAKAPQRKVNDWLRMKQDERDAVESRVAAEVADELVRRLPRNAKQAAALLKRGHELAAAMSWDRVFGQKVLPELRRIASGKRP